MSESGGPRVRVGNVPVVHGVTPGGWTTCGIMYTDDPGTFFFVKSAATNDPVDCVTCLVQETRGPTKTIHFHTVINTAAIAKLTFDEE